MKTKDYDDFDDIDDFDDLDEFESVDLSGSKNRSSGYGYDTYNSAAGTSGGAASRMNGTGSGSSYMNGAGSGFGRASEEMHAFIDDPTFDPTIDDEYDDFPEDFDMHGDTGYADRAASGSSYPGGGYMDKRSSSSNYADSGYAGRYGQGALSDEDPDYDLDDFDDDFDMHGDAGFDIEQDTVGTYTGRQDVGTGRSGGHAFGTGSGRGRSAGGSETGLARRSAAGRGSGDDRDPGKSRSSDKKPAGKSSLLRRIIAFAIAEVLVLTGIFSYAFIKRQYNKIQRPDIDISAVTNPNLSIEDIQKMDEGFWTVAIFGLDSRDSSAGKGNNSDVIIVASIDRQTGEIKLVSVFRDTYLSTGDGKYNKINAAYCNGGPEQAIKALNENLDLNITQYVSFNWKAVATAINMLGGVDVELSKAEFYYINSFITETVKGTGIASVHLKQAGLNHLDGVQAVAYARLRYMDNDYARTERQRKIIGLCFEKVKKTDPSTLLNMAGVMLEMVATNMGWQEASEAVGMLSKLYMGDTGGFPYARGEAVIGKRGSCVIPQTLESNVAELHRQLYHEEDYQCSEKVKSIGAHISAESGMYTEGTFIGHVSTQGYIPETKTTAAAATSAAETTAGESETVESQSSSLPDIEDMTDEELQEAIEEYLKELGITADDREYSVSTDGYVIYVSGQDADGLPTYKYVLGNDGKRIRISESMQETTEAESSSSAAETTSARTTTAAAPSPGATTEASGPGASKSSSETSAVETRAASSETIEAQTTGAVTPGSTTSHSPAASHTTTEAEAASPTPRTTAAATSAVTPGSSTTAASTTAAYPGSSTTSDSGTGPGSSSSGTSATGTVTPGSVTTTTAATVTPGGSTTGEIVPAAP